MKDYLRYGMLIVAMAVIGCSPKNPDPIIYGKDQCYYCRMSIAEPQFGAEIITSKGRIYKYDALECLVNQLSEDTSLEGRCFAIPYDRPRELFSVDSLHYIISERYRSPMGANLAAFYDQSAFDGRALSWNELNEKFSGE